jgi:hypothetical protein
VRVAVVRQHLTLEVILNECQRSAHGVKEEINRKGQTCIIL